MGRKGKETTVAERQLVVEFLKEGLSYRKIGNLMGRSYATIQHIVKRFKENNTIQNYPRPGRAHKINQFTKRYLLSVIKKTPDITISALATALETHFGLKASLETIRRAVRCKSQTEESVRKLPWVSRLNKAQRLLFAKEYREYRVSFWNKIIFSDECKFNLFFSEDKTVVWRTPSEEMETKYHQPTANPNSESVHVWGCMSAAGVGSLAIVDGIRTRSKYIIMLKSNLETSSDKLGVVGDYTFQHVGGHTHKAWDVKMWLLHNVPRVLMSPPQSPDLNMMEPLWAHMEVELNRYKISNCAELITALKLEWDSIDSRLCEISVKSMPRKLRAIIKADGNATYY